MSNRTYTSPWFSLSEFYGFVDQLMRGDIVEFDRGAYRHFGIYAGQSVLLLLLLLFYSGSRCSLY